MATAGQPPALAKSLELIKTFVGDPSSPVTPVTASKLNPLAKEFVSPRESQQPRPSVASKISAETAKKPVPLTIVQKGPTQAQQPKAPVLGPPSAVPAQFGNRQKSPFHSQ